MLNYFWTGSPILLLRSKFIKVCSIHDTRFIVLSFYQFRWLVFQLIICFAKLKRFNEPQNPCKMLLWRWSVSCEYGVQTLPLTFIVNWLRLLGICWINIGQVLKNWFASISSDSFFLREWTFPTEGLLKVKITLTLAFGVSERAVGITRTATKA